MKNFLKKLILKLENYKITFNQFLLSLLAIAFIRSFCEGIFERKRVIGHILTENYYDSFRHNFNFWNLEWITMFITLSLIFYLFTKENLIKISKILLVFYPIIILPVILDYFIYFPYSSDITYFYTVDEYINGLVNFFVFSKEIPKASLGVRIEVFLAVIFSFIYIYIKKSNFLLSILCAFFVYFIAISSMAFPVFILLPSLFFLKKPNEFIWDFFSNAHFPFDSESKISIMIFFFLIFVLSIYFSILNKKDFLYILNLLFKEKFLLFNIFIFIFSFFYAAKYKFYTTKLNIFNSYFIGFFILAGILLVFLLLILFILFKNKIFNYLFITFLLLTLFLSISISYAIFLTTIFILTIYIILFNKPFLFFDNFILKNFIYSLLNLLFILLGFAKIFGIYAPQNILFSFSAPLFLIFLCNNFLYESDNKNLNILLLILVILAYLIFGYFSGKEIIFIFSFIISLLSILVFFIKKSYLNIIIIVFLCLFLIFV